MNRRYHCDYCDRSFNDNLEARKKHIQGTLHTRNRKLHYKKFRDLNTLVEEESEKTECRRFLQSGNCQFGENCNFTHYSKSQLNEIRKQVQEDYKSKNKIPEVPTVESWFEKRNKKSGLAETTIQQPLNNMDLKDLPISLQPINYYEVTNIEFCKWGE